MSDPERLILIGCVAGAFGVKGELKITAYGDDPLALLRYRKLEREDGSAALTLASGRAARGGLIAKAEEVADRTAADALRGLRLYVARSALPPPDEDEFYLADLIGLEARTPNGEIVGRVTAVHDFGAGEVIEIQSQSGVAWMAPFTRTAVPEVRITDGWLTVAPPLDEVATP